MKDEILEAVDQRIDTAFNTRGSTSGSSSQAPGRTVTFKDFMACQRKDPIACFRWVAAVEGAFRTSGCPREMKVIYALNLLRNAGKDWWGLILKSRTEEQINAITWDEFKVQLDEQFAPRIEKQRITSEFLNLAQTTETVNEITDQFMEKSLFCSDYVSTEEMKMFRYRGVLKTEIREFVATSMCKTFDAMVEVARARELYLEEHRQGKRKAEQEQCPGVSTAIARMLQMQKAWSSKSGVRGRTEDLFSLLSAGAHQTQLPSVGWSSSSSDTNTHSIDDHRRFDEQDERVYYWRPWLSVSADGRGDGGRSRCGCREGMPMYTPEEGVVADLAAAVAASTALASASVDTAFAASSSVCRARIVDREPHALGELWGPTRVLTDGRKGIHMPLVPFRLRIRAKLECDSEMMIPTAFDFCSQVTEALHQILPGLFAQTKDEILEAVDKRIDTAFTTRGSTSGSSSQAPGCTVTFKDFMACQPPLFEGRKDPIACFRWVPAVEGAFRTSGCPGEMKVIYALNLLRNAGKDWWGLILKSRTEEQINAITWDEFKVQLDEQFAPRIEKQRITSEFLNLAQTTETVNEITDQFMEKSLFCLDYVSTEEMKMFCSSSGAVPGGTPPREEEGGAGAVPVKKSKGQRSDGRKEFSGCPKCGKNHSGECQLPVPVCFKCRKPGHRSRECGVEPRTCSHCFQPGHIKPNCPQLVGAAPAAIPTPTPLMITDGSTSKKSGSTTGGRGRVFQLTAEETEADPDVVADCEEQLVRIQNPSGGELIVYGEDSRNI
ncbi:hypothetical protein OSB04_024701 [Centaurea solstitialis]|uniref:CCHC-type domain-containing protein n=1 Tax=Centaurea solstitialis TaxID=347529 RepID=A0AA38SLN8_9ASTR|nr:hypothetical protein OSB04_024701 [Centaurea solstitialis]